MTMAHILTEQILRVPAAAAVVGVDPATINRWLNQGVLKDGWRVQLEGLKMGGHWLTSREALARFAERLTSASPPVEPAPAQDPERETRAAAAERKARAMGI